MRTPRISGYALASLARLARGPIGSAALRGMLRKDLRVELLADLPDALRGDVPLDTRPLQARPPRTGEERENDRLAPPGASAWAGTSETFVRAYREGATTPREVMDRALDTARELGSRVPSGGSRSSTWRRRRRLRKPTLRRLRWEGREAERSNGRRPVRRERANRGARPPSALGRAVQ